MHIHPEMARLLAKTKLEDARPQMPSIRVRQAAPRRQTKLAGTPSRIRSFRSKAPANTPAR